MKLWTLVLVVATAMALPALAAQPQDAPAASANWTRKTEKAQPVATAAADEADESAQPADAGAVSEASEGTAAAEAEAAVTEPGEGEAEEAGAERAETGVEQGEAVEEDAPAATDPAAPAAQELAAEETSEAGEPEGAPESFVEPAAAPAARSVELGPIAWDDEGRKGRIHTVVPGDTLWDISEAYLGTPWVWPNIWNDNGGIQNPHLIEPGDRIWISSTEMRRLSDEEAMAMLAPQVPPAAQEEGEVEAPPEEEIEGEPATMESLPVALDQGAVGRGTTGEVLLLPGRGMMGFVAAEVVEGASSIIGSVAERTMLFQGDEVYVGFGRGDAKAGDQYTLFRDPTIVRDPRGRPIGYHVDVVGHTEIEDVGLESSLAVITESKSEINIGDLLMPRQIIPTRVPLKHSPAGLHGSVVFLPYGRTMMGKDDLVYLDRGAIHGLEMGSELEVFEHGYDAQDRTQGEWLRTPDLVVARLVVISAQEETSVAYVVAADREIEVGDLVRSRVKEVARKR